MQRQSTLLLIVSILLIIAINLWLYLLQTNVDPVKNLISIDSLHCQPNSQNCIFKYRDYIFQLTMDHDISPLKPFRVQIHTDAKHIQEIIVSFEMKNMDMGTNQFHLVRQTNEIWEANAIIPICTTGRSDWLFRVEIDLGNEIIHTTYEIEV